MGIMFLIVWYYCTLTIRESILIVNGSRIKGWWRTHHFISCVVGGVLLVWPDGPSYRDFRDQHMLFNVYVAFLQYLQYVYQKGCLYRLRSLGERKEMDITIDGFHSWMWKGLSFLLPFLYLGYLMQLYNAYTLYQLMYIHEVGWQVPALALLFFTLGCGNIITTSMTIPLKLKDSQLGLLKYRFTRLDKYFWNHRKRRNSISKATPFVEKVDNVLMRSNSTLGRPSVSSRDNTIPRLRILMKLDLRLRKSQKCCLELMMKEMETVRKTLETMKARRYCDILLNGEFQMKQIYFVNCKNLN